MDATPALPPRGRSLVRLRAHGVLRASFYLIATFDLQKPILHLKRHSKL